MWPILPKVCSNTGIDCLGCRARNGWGRDAAEHSTPICAERTTRDGWSFATVHGELGTVVAHVVALPDDAEDPTKTRQVPLAEYPKSIRGSALGIFCVDKPA
jgi:hypothetical protein